MTPLPQKNTVVILDSCGERALQFFDFPLDLSAWSGAILNSTLIDPDLEDQIIATLFPTDSAGPESFPVSELRDHVDGWNTEIVVVVFLP